MMEECKVCANADNEYCFACDNGNQFKPMTNADRIRAMTDEELAVGLRSVIDCELCPVIADCDGEAATPSCFEILLAWLKSPADPVNEEAGE